LKNLQTILFQTVLLEESHPPAWQEQIVNMNLNELTAISPIDGRYRRKLSELAPYFSEFGLIKYRVLVEIEYLIALSNSGIAPLNPFPKDKVDALRGVYIHFTEADALVIKETEKTTNHDVKAVEYFVKSKLEELGLSQFLEFVHFGLTSQDINNTAIPRSLKDALNESYIPALEKLRNHLHE